MVYFIYENCNPLVITPAKLHYMNTICNCSQLLTGESRIFARFYSEAVAHVEHTFLTLSFLVSSFLS